MAVFVALDIDHTVVLVDAGMADSEALQELDGDMVLVASDTAGLVVEDRISEDSLVDRADFEVDILKK